MDKELLLFSFFKYPVFQILKVTFLIYLNYTTSTQINVSAFLLTVPALFSQHSSQPIEELVED